MADLPPNFNIYPLVGLVGNRADGVDPSEILNLLLKKTFNIPNAKPYKNYAFDSAFYNSTLHLNSRNVYSQIVPEYVDKNTLIIDPTWYNPAYISADNTYGVKYILPNYPYISYYSNVLMIKAETDGISFFVGNNDLGINLTQNTIPKNYGKNDVPSLSYDYTLTSFDNSFTLFFGDLTCGSWLLDSDSGVLTFYDTVTATTVNATYPPRISFWRYEGLTGNSGISELYELD